MTEEKKDALAFDDSVDPIYKKGFEHGYWLRQGDSPDLDGVIEGSKNHANYSSGLKAGKKEAEREQVRARLQGSKVQSNDHEKGMDLD